MSGDPVSSRSTAPPIKLVAIFVRYINATAIMLPVLIRSFPSFSISATSIPIETNIKD